MIFIYVGLTNILSFLGGGDINGIEMCLVVWLCAQNSVSQQKWRTVCKESITVISLYFRGFNQDIL